MAEAQAVGALGRDWAEESILWNRHLSSIWTRLETEYLYDAPSEALGLTIQGLLATPDNQLFWEHPQGILTDEFVSYVEGPSDSWAGRGHDPGCAVTAADTTAARDAFNGALAVEGNRRALSPRFPNERRWSGARPLDHPLGISPRWASSRDGGESRPTARRRGRPIRPHPRPCAGDAPPQPYTTWRPRPG